MKIFPAIDIINGECVRLTKGRAENKTIYDKSPVEMAKIYQDKGFETIHVVDLDATLAFTQDQINLFGKLGKYKSIGKSHLKEKFSFFLQRKNI